MIDGDTIRVQLDGARDTVRLTGVDTPETRHPTRGVEPSGPEAAAYTTARLTGATVRLDRDPAGDDIDAYGRLLRYVVLASGEHVNATLISEGLATAIRAFPYARQREFLQLEAQARAARIHPEPIRSTGLTRRLALARRAADLMEATAADACALKQRAGIRLWRIRAKWHTLTFTFYWEPEPPADEPAVIRAAVDVLRATELQAAIVRGADDDGPCTILMFNTIHPATGRVHRSRDIYPDLLRWNLRREGVRLRGLMDFLRAAHEQHLRSKPDRAPWYRDIENRRADDDTTQ